MRWLGLLALAALPLQWFVVAGTPLGVMRLHQAVFLGVAVVLVLARPMRNLVPVLRLTKVFLALNALMLVVWAAVTLYHGALPTIPIQEGIYLGVFVIMATYFFRAASGQEAGALKALRWSATGAAGLFVAALLLSMVSNGVNPMNVIQQTLATSNPEVLQKELFRSSFVGYGYDAASIRGNIRHEIFGAILLAMYVSVWAEGLLPKVRDLGWRVRQAGLVLASLLLLVSMSRAVLIAAAAWPLLYVYRSLRTMTLSNRQVATIYVVGGAFILLLVSGVGEVIWVRFTQDTASYSSRGGLYDAAFANLRSTWLFGGEDTTGQSSHNFAIDAWLRGGIVVFLLALCILALLIVVWLSLLVNLPRAPMWMVPVAAAFALPIDRMLTSGGGLIPPVSWLTLAFAAGALCYRSELQRRETERILARTTGGPADDDLADVQTS